jgi:hypothetical protein
MTPAMNFEDALDLLIATSITCLGNGKPKLKRAVEIATSYRELSPTSAPSISVEQLDALQMWFGAAGGFSAASLFHVSVDADERGDVLKRGQQ